MGRRTTVWALILLVVGCSAYPGARVSTAPDGQLLVDVKEAQSFRALALFLYGDANLGPTVAKLANLDPRGGVPAGARLELPSKEAVKERAERQEKLAKLVVRAQDDLKSGKTARAIERFREALELDPENTVGMLSLARAYLRVDRVAEALPLAKSVAEREPNNPGARATLAATYRRQNRLQDALVEYEAAFAVARESWRAPRHAYNYARTLQDVGEHERARNAFKLYLYEYPGDPYNESAESHVEDLDKLIRLETQP